jgi:hypothetical protein
MKSSLGAVVSTDRVRALMVILFLAALFLGSLAGCGGGGGHPGDPDSPVQLQNTSNATLAITIGNLPSSVAAAVRVTGPGNYTVELAQSQTLSGIPPGSYTVTALPVVAGTATWIPLPSTQGVTVGAGATVAVRVDYALQLTRRT